MPLPVAGFVSPYEIVRTIRNAGFHPLAPPMREGPTYVLRATDYRGILMRVVVDARSGAIRDVTRIVPGPNPLGEIGMLPRPYGAPYGPPPYAVPAYGEPALDRREELQMSRLPGAMPPLQANPPIPPILTSRPALPPLPRPRPAELAARQAEAPPAANTADKPAGAAPAVAAAPEVKSPAPPSSAASASASSAAAAAPPAPATGTKPPPAPPIND